MILVQGGLPVPRVNPEVYCPAAGVKYRVDMGYVKEKVGPEYDGAYHGTREQMRLDARRRAQLQEAGWMLINFTDADLDNPKQMVRLVESALVHRRAMRESSRTARF